MLAKYAGRIINGKPTFLEPITLPVTLPENTEIIIAVELPATTRAQTPTQIAAAQFLTGIERIKKEDFTAEDREAFTKFDRGDYKIKFDGVLDV